jgi:hypothetical protein
MIRHRLIFPSALFALTAIGSAAAQENPTQYCAQHPDELRCKAFTGAASRARSDTGNTGGRQRFGPPNSNRTRPQPGG